MGSNANDYTINTQQARVAAGQLAASVVEAMNVVRSGKDLAENLPTMGPFAAVIHTALRQGFDQVHSATEKVTGQFGDMNATFVDVALPAYENTEYDAVRQLSDVTRGING